MIVLALDGELRQMEFREFAELIVAGRVPDSALVRGDVLTGGHPVRAGDLRTYAILRGRPLPPARVIPQDPERTNITLALDRIRWYPAVSVLPESPTTGLTAETRRAQTTQRKVVLKPQMHADERR